MIKLSWIFVVLLVAHVGDLFCLTPLLQLFVSAVAVFYLAIQCGWRVTVPAALILGLLMDVSFGCSTYFYTCFLPVVPLLVADFWLKHGDCGNLPMQVLPLFALSCFASGARLILIFQWGDNFSQFWYAFIYFSLSSILTAVVGTVFIAFMDELAGYVGMPLFSSVNKS